MSAQTLTPEEARELCARLGRTPETLARLFDRNAELLARLNSPLGAAIERQNARACRAAMELQRATYTVLSLLSGEHTLTPVDGGKAVGI